MRSEGERERDPVRVRVLVLLGRKSLVSNNPLPGALRLGAMPEVRMAGGGEVSSDERSENVDRALQTGVSD